MRLYSLLLIFLLLGLSFSVFSQNVGINDDNSNPDPSAMLDVKSQTKGMLIPRMTTAQRTSIAAPATGLLVYDNTTTSFWFYNGTKWVELLSGTVTDTDTLTLTGNILSISGGNSVDLTTFLDNTDAQTLTFNNDSLSISGGNKVGLSSLNTDSQTLALSNDSLSISGGNKIDLSSVNTDSQTLTFNNDSLLISGGNKVDLSSINTDKQTLTLTGDSLFISGGNKISLAVFVNDTLPLIQDADRNTKVQVEKNANEDVVRFDMGGTEYFNMTKGGRLNVENSGESVFIGEDAGKNDDLTTNKNVAIGYQSLLNNITGVGNVGVGFSTLKSNTANSNTAVGYQSMPSNTTGTWNSAFGQNSLLGNTTGIYNVALGGQALAGNTTGSSNIAIGMDACLSHSTGDNNVVIGYKAGANNISGGGNLFLGYLAGMNETGSDKLYIENSSSSTPLIYGNFANDSVKIYGTLNIQNKYSFPNVDGTSGQLLTTDGAGALSWANATVNTDAQTLTIDNTNANLSISNGNTVTLSTISDADANTKVMTEESANNNRVSIYANGTNTANFTSTGLGIGTTSPNYKLHITDNVNSSLGVWVDGTGPSIIYKANQGGTKDLKFTFENSSGTQTEVARIVGNGNTGYFGIGTTSPSQKLHVEGTILAENPGTSPSGSQIYLSSPANDIGVTINRGDGSGGTAQRWDMKITSDSALRFRSANANDYVAFTNKGYVGIGETSPAAYLDIKGTNSGTTSMFLRSGNVSTSSLSTQIAFGYNGSTNYSHSIKTRHMSGSKNGNAIDFFVWDQGVDATGAIGTKRVMTIDGNGNGMVGIGTISPQNELHVVGNIRMVDGNQAANKVMASDANGTATWTSISSLVSGDNLGNHTATQNILLNNNYLSNDGGSEGVKVDNSGNTTINVSGTDYFTLSSGGRLGVLNSGNSVFIGQNAGSADDLSNNNNTFVGYYSGATNTTGNDNSGFGNWSLRTNTTGINNSAFGSNSLQANTIGFSNAAFGGWTLYLNTTGNENTAIATGSMAGNTTGSDNTAVGINSLNKNSTGNYNVSLGAFTMQSSVSGSNNIAIGYQAGHNALGSSNILLGYQAGYNETGSDKLYIENSNSSTPLIYGNFADDSVKINGDFQVGQNGDGTVAVANAWNTFSDRRYKTDFKLIENALAKVQAVNGYYYKWKDKPDTTLQVGVIAQEIEAVLPQVVTTNAEGYKSVDYSKLTALLIEALKEQQAIIENQEKSISDLKDDMAMIKQYLQLNTEAKK